MEDIGKLKNPEDIKHFDTSEVARNAVKIIGEFQDNPDAPLTTSQYTLVRDYLMTMICIDNGSRSGPISNMTLEEFSNCSKEEDHFVVRVKKHKTFSTHGPANLVLTSSLHEYLKIFINIFRSQIAAVDSTPKSTVFLSWRGTPFGFLTGWCTNWFLLGKGVWKRRVVRWSDFFSQSCCVCS